MVGSRLAHVLRKIIASDIYRPGYQAHSMSHVGVQRACSLRACALHTNMSCAECLTHVDFTSNDQAIYKMLWKSTLCCCIWVLSGSVYNCTGSRDRHRATQRC